MPVEDVELVHLHEVDVVPENRLGNVVPAGVQQDAPVGEPGGVEDLSSIDKELKKSIVLLQCVIIINSCEYQPPPPSFFLFVFVNLIIVKSIYLNKKKIFILACIKEEIIIKLAILTCIILHVILYLCTLVF